MGGESKAASTVFTCCKNYVRFQKGGELERGEDAGIEGTCLWARGRERKGWRDPGKY